MPYERLRGKLAAGEAVVGGVLSGTSADGIDVGLARMRAVDAVLAELEPLAFAIEPFPADLAGRVRAVLDGREPGLRGTALLHRDLGRAFGAAARGVAERFGLALDLLGSHGQTVWHHDGDERAGPATLQLGDGDFAAEAAGCTVVSDFRQRDVAAGGEGAPLSALADDLLFASAPRPTAVLNLGGMANLTILTERDVLAFDVGPAGSLLDGLARRLLGAPFDRDGAAAARGTADPALVRTILAHPFFAAAPPKSTGRDTFGERFVTGLLGAARGRDPDDVLASAVHAVAASVADALERFVADRPGELVVAGGGARNGALLRSLAEHTGVPVVSSDRYGIPPDAREAHVFAVLAARHVLGEPATRRGATGAAAGRVLGKLSPPPPE